MFVVLLFADDRHPLAPLSVGIGKSIPHSGGRVKGHSAGVISVTPVRRAGSVSRTAAAVIVALTLLVLQAVLTVVLAKSVQKDTLIERVRFSE